MLNLSKGLHPMVSFLFRLAWESRVRLPILIAAAFMVTNMHMRLEININFDFEENLDLQVDAEANEEEEDESTEEEEMSDAEETNVELIEACDNILEMNEDSRLRPIYSINSDFVISENINNTEESDPR